MLKDLTIKNFIEDLASSKPAPGGGSVSAFSAAIAASLCSMVFNLTINKKAFKELNEEIKKIVMNALENSNKLKDDFLDLMNKDAVEFEKFIDIYKQKVNNDEERKAKEESLEEAYKKALGVPLEVARKAIKVYDYINIACDYGNKNLISDGGVSAMTLQTALESAVLNVRVNLPGIKDENYKAIIILECDAIIAEGLIKKENILKKVYNNIG